MNSNKFSISNLGYIGTIILLFISTFLFAQGTVLFDDSYLHEIRFENVDSTIFIATKDYQSVKMIVDGVTINTVGLKKKGNISATHANNKFPFKIKTNKYVTDQEYDGIREFTLNNSFQDPSMMREKLTFDLSAQLGLYSLRTAFAKVYIDNLYWGVYTIVEGKDEMYKHIFNNRDGDGIESTDFGDMCYYGTTRNDYQHPSVGDRYIVDNGNETTTWNRLIPMLEKTNNTPAVDYVDTVSNYLNITDFVKYQALNVYLLNFDSYIGFIGNQVYFYDENVNYWQVIPWDFNASFGLWNTNNYTPTTFPLMPTAITNGCIASHIDNVPSLKNTYLQAICDFTASVADTVALNQRIDGLRNQIKTAVYADWRKEFSNSDFENALAYGYYTHNGESVPALKTFVKDRFETISQALNNINYSCITNTISIEEKNQFSIFPNPANSVTTIQLEQLLPNTSIYIYNGYGQEIKVIKPINNLIQIDFSANSSGVYFIQYGTITKKVIVAK